RRDVLAAADDDVLLAVDDVDVVLFVPYGHVAGVQPAFGHYIGGGARLLVVTVHHLIPPEHHPPARGHFARHRPPLHGDSGELASRHRPARHRAVAQAVGLIGEDDGRFVARAGCDW